METALSDLMMPTNMAESMEPANVRTGTSSEEPPVVFFDSTLLAIRVSKVWFSRSAD